MLGKKKKKTNMLTKRRKKMKSYLQKLLAIQVLAREPQSHSLQQSPGLKVPKKRGSEMFGVHVVCASSTERGI